MNKTINILYLEDSAADAELFSICVSRYARRCHKEGEVTLEIADTVEMAQQMFEIGKYQSIVLDWNVSGGSGTDVAEFIRQIDKDIPIFMVSGAMNEHQRQASKKFNPTACLEKDYTQSFTEQVCLHQVI